MKEAYEAFAGEVNAKMEVARQIVDLLGDLRYDMTEFSLSDGVLQIQIHLVGLMIAVEIYHEDERVNIDVGHGKDEYTGWKWEECASAADACVWIKAIS